MSSDPDRRVMIIGGGIGGLAAGIALRRAGIDATVFERMAELREVGSGLTLWTNAMRTLDKMELGDAVRARGSEITRMENRSLDTGFLNEMPVGDVGRRYGSASIALHRAELQSVLAGVLDERALVLGAALTGFEQDGSGVTARFADGREERGALLIGADGIRSAVRGQLLGAGKPRYAGYTCWRSALPFEHPAIPPATSLQIYGAGSIFGLFPAGKGITVWYGTRLSPPDAPDAAEGRKKEALAQFRGWPAPVEALIEATEEAAINRLDICDREPDARWGSERVTLLGDAAHPTTPVLGQGGCMAIEDAFVLAQCLSQKGDPVASLRAYETRRRERTAMIQRMAWRWGVIHHWQSPAGCWLRETIMRRSPAGQVRKALDQLLGYEAWATA